MLVKMLLRDVNIHTQLEKSFLKETREYFFSLNVTGMEIITIIINKYETRKILILDKGEKRTAPRVIRVKKKQEKISQPRMKSIISLRSWNCSFSRLRIEAKKPTR